MNVLFLIENVPYVLDSRVRRQASAVVAMGGRAFVICPRGDIPAVSRPDDDGVVVYQYYRPQLPPSQLAHLLEYAVSLVAQALLTFYVWLRYGVHIIHGANPPDLHWIVAAPYRWFGTAYIFDHHDLVPELYGVRYRDGLFARAVLWCEWMSVHVADHVISTNETFRKIAIERGGKSPAKVTVVRNGPWLAKDFAPIRHGRIAPRAAGEIVVGYLGIMNPQDQLENLLEAIRIVRDDFGRASISLVAIGSGDAYADLVALRDRLGLGPQVSMPGTLPWPEVLSRLSTVDICVQPDLPTPFNRNLTMNKLMEYMALGKATIAYAMPETMVSGGDAVLYVEEATPRALAEAILRLADDPLERETFGARARHRVEAKLAWEHQVPILEGVYRQTLSTTANSFWSR